MCDICDLFDTLPDGVVLEKMPTKTEFKIPKYCVYIDMKDLIDGVVIGHGDTVLDSLEDAVHNGLTERGS